jgi:hypothetical protein
MPYLHQDIQALNLFAQVNVSTGKTASVGRSLVEDVPIRSVERITGMRTQTIMRPLFAVGQG